jgi:hypothetical protein
MTCLKMLWEATHIKNILANWDAQLYSDHMTYKSSFLEPFIPAPISIYPSNRN